MKYVFECRRTFTAIFSIICLTSLGIMVKAEVAGAIATIAMAIAASNACQKVWEKKDK